MAGLIQPTGRLPEVTVGGFTGNARLLMQDSVLQLFAATPASHLSRVFAHDEHQKKSARALFEAMQTGCAEYLSANDATQHVGDRTTPCTILQAKLALAAERLVAGAPLLIMDEPGWCLSRLATQGFVREVTRAAHGCKTAVAIISHERHWWRGLMADELLFSHSAVKDSVTISKGSVS
jgi:ABC-type branched-subunit amino acid transport system ATPase component